MLFVTYFSFTDRDGNLQTSDCVQALLAMESQGSISLRDTISHGQRKSEKASGIYHPCLSEIAAPTNVPATVNEREDLQLILVENEEKRQIWGSAQGTTVECGFPPDPRFSPTTAYL